MASPGKVASHHAVDRYTRPSASIPPHVGVGGWTPSPRNDNADAGHVERGDHQPRRERVREDVAHENTPVPDAKRLGGLDELAFPDRQDGAADDAGVDDPARDTDDGNDRHQARPEHSDHRDGEEDERKSELDVSQTHQNVVHRATEVAGEESRDHPEDAGDQHRGDADQKGWPGSEDHASENVAAEMIGTERVNISRPVLPSRRLQAILQILPERVEG